MRKDELNAISGPNEFAEFYNRLKQIKDFHRKHPHEVDMKFQLSPCSELHAFVLESEHVSLSAREAGSGVVVMFSPEWRALAQPRMSFVIYCFENVK